MNVRERGRAWDQVGYRSIFSAPAADARPAWVD